MRCGKKSFPIGALIVDAHGAMETAEQHTGIDSDYCAGDICLEGKGSGWRLEADMPGNDFIVMTPRGATMHGRLPIEILF